MYKFSHVAVKLLRDYKTLIRKLPSQESEDKLASLQLDKRLPAKESALYEMLANVIRVEDEERRQAVRQSRTRYCGWTQLLKHMKKVIDLYTVENKKVVNSTQLASRSMIEAIQLMMLPSNKRNIALADKLKTCAEHVAKHGSEEQKQIFHDSLQTYAAHDDVFFRPLLERFEDHRRSLRAQSNCSANEESIFEEEEEEELAC